MKPFSTTQRLLNRFYPRPAKNVEVILRIVPSEPNFRSFFFTGLLESRGSNLTTGLRIESVSAQHIHKIIIFVPTALPSRICNDIRNSGITTHRPYCASLFIPATLSLYTCILPVNYRRAILKWSILLLAGQASLGATWCIGCSKDQILKSSFTTISAQAGPGTCPTILA